jgi:hypothetical protein
MESQIARMSNTQRSWPALVGLALLAASASVQAQYDYSTNTNGPFGPITLNITGYTGSGGDVIIPTSINGWTVTSIASNAFQLSSTLTNLTIPASVTSIGSEAFSSCVNLANVTISNSITGFPPSGVTSIGYGAFFGCSSLTNVAIPASVTSIGQQAFLGTGVASVTFPGSVSNIEDETFDFCTNLTNVTISAGVTSIGQAAFASCSGLTSVTIPGSVTSISNAAFDDCSSLTNVFFNGNAPTVGSSVFSNDTNATVYYLPGTTGWSSPFAGRPAVLWNPLIQAGGASFGVQNNQFGFNITGTTNIPIVVEACTNLANPDWILLTNVTLTNGLFYFSEPVQTNISGRYYRISSP